MPTINSKEKEKRNELSNIHKQFKVTLSENQYKALKKFKTLCDVRKRYVAKKIKHYETLLGESVFTVKFLAIPKGKTKQDKIDMFSELVSWASSAPINEIENDLENWDKKLEVEFPTSYRKLYTNPNKDIYDDV